VGTIEDNKNTPSSEKPSRELSQEDKAIILDELYQQLEIKVKNKLHREAEEAGKPKQERTYNLACREFPATDLGNSWRFVKRCKPIAKFCHAHKSWYIWDERRWRKDQIGKAIELAKDVITRISDEAESAGSDLSSRLYKWAIKSQARPRVDAILYLAQSAMPVLPEQLDAHPDLINLQNCTLDLISQKTHPANKDDLLTKLSGVTYDPVSKCPLWIEHVHLIFNGDPDLIEAFQRVVGYTLLQENPEQVLFILHGNGKNGKSKTIEVLAYILGEYAVNIAAETLMSQRFKGNTGPRSDIARISGARMVSASEGEAGCHLSESLVKVLTGDDKATVRRLYENEIEFRPTAKIFLATNHRPVITGTDDAIWRRIWLIPFTVTIPDNKRDPEIAKKLIAEAPGILNWALEGLKRYRAVGKLVQPEKVRVATAEYRQDSDVLKEFIEDWCQPKGEIKRRDLYKNYVDWCEQYHEKAVSTKRFADLLRERGGGERATGGERYWVGLSARGFFN